MLSPYSFVERSARGNLLTSEESQCAQARIPTQRWSAMAGQIATIAVITNKTVGVR